MIVACEGNVEDFLEAEYLCNASNSEGVMSLKQSLSWSGKGGLDIQRDAMRYCNKRYPKEGTMFTTVSGKLPFKRIIHLVLSETAKGFTNYSIVRQCLRSLCIYCNTHKVKSVVLPAIGTGEGRLATPEIIKIYMEELLLAKGTTFHVVDKSRTFIESLNESLSNNQEAI